MPASADALIAAAKRVAVPVASCVAASLRPDHLLCDRSWEELAALVVVLAEAADPVRLRAVVAAPDGLDEQVPRDVVLRRAHAEAAMLRKTGRPVPFRLRLLDSEYRADRKRKRAAAGAEPSRAA